MIWTEKGFDYKKVNQYYFQNDEPHTSNLGNISISRWPPNRPPVLDEKLIPYFTTLKDIRPDVTDSLDRCVEHLTNPGTEYTGNLDEGKYDFISTIYNTF